MAGDMDSHITGPCDRKLAVGGLHGSDHHNDQLPLFGLALILICGGMIQHFGSGVPLPYTALLLILGVALGAWVQFDPNFTLQPGMIAGEHSWDGVTLACNVTDYVPNDLHFHGWHLGNSLRQVSGMDPHLMLHVLLPPLLFESAFAIDWHIFSKISGYALILAGPGLVVCTLCGGLTYMGLYGWGWEPAMLLGGILSATDPVAVVALLREMGVKKSLATLIEAESLLNDGTAVVVYSILLHAVRAGGLAAWLDVTSSVGYWHILWIVVRMSVLGPIFGIILGVVSVKWLEANAGADRDANVEVICTLAMPFLVFYLAETAFGESMQMSGVLAVVCYGLVFASPFGKVRIDTNIEHFLHEFWGMVGHLVNTLVFVLSGIIIVTSINWRSDTLGVDVAYGLVSYAVMAAYRAIVMFGVMPVFKRGHYGYSWQDALVITWGGLRGAVGLALAISVFLDEGLQDGAVFGDSSVSGAATHYRQVVLVHTSLIVMLTLLINAPTSGPILKLIGLTKLSTTRVSMLQLSQRQLNKRTSGILSNMVSHPVHSDVSWVGVQRLANYDEMVANILGQQYTFNPEQVWKPSPPSPMPPTKTDQAERPLAVQRRARASHESYEAVGCRRRRKESTETMGTAAHSKDDNRKELSSERAADAVAHWRALRTKLNATVGLAGANFVQDFQARLAQKRLHEAKYRVLEQLKANVWSMFESGQMRPFTAQRLKALVMDQIDELEAGKVVEANPLPFAPLKQALRHRPTVAGCASIFEACSRKSALLRPLMDQANGLLFHEFERGYDAVVGYLLAHEEILASHDHGHTFSLDKALDRRFKNEVKRNIEEALKELALLRLRWPKLCTALNTFKAARLVLNGGHNLVNELGHHGVLHETEAGRLLDFIAESKARLNSLSPVLALAEGERSNFFPSQSDNEPTEAAIRAMAAELRYIEDNGAPSSSFSFMKGSKLASSKKNVKVATADHSTNAASGATPPAAPKRGATLGKILLGATTRVSNLSTTTAVASTFSADSVEDGQSRVLDVAETPPQGSSEFEDKV